MDNDPAAQAIESSSGDFSPAITETDDWQLIKGRRAYTVKKKMQILEDLRVKYNGIKSMCSKSEGIPRPTLILWIKEAEKFKLVSSSRVESVKRVRHMLDPEEKNKRAKFPEVESKLMERIKEQRAKGLTVSCTILQMEGKRIFDQLHASDSNESATTFTASLGWVSKFLHRYNLVQRSFTPIGQMVPAHAAQLVSEMFRLFDDKAVGIKHADIANMDETPVYFDMPGGRTYDMRGIKTVKC